jgi:hypothetical protein
LGKKLRDTDSKPVSFTRFREPSLLNDQLVGPRPLVVNPAGKQADDPDIRIIQIGERVSGGNIAQTLIVAVSNTSDPCQPHTIQTLHHDRLLLIGGSAYAIVVKPLPEATAMIHVSLNNV